MCLVAKCYSQKKGLTSKRPSIWYIWRTLWGKSWLLNFIILWSYIRWMSKQCFIMATLMKQMYMVNPKNFVSSYLKKLVCNLTRFIYWLKEVVSLVILRSLIRILSYLALRQILWTIIGITSSVGVSLYSWYYLLMIVY